MIKLQAQACNFIKKEIIAHEFSYEFCEIHRPATLSKKGFWYKVFSCEFYEICRNNFLIEHLRATASGVISNNRFPFNNFVFIICLQKQNISYIFFTCNNFLQKR